LAEVSKADGGKVQQWSKSGGDNQKVSFKEHGDDSFTIVFKHSGKVLDVSGRSTENGTQLQQWSESGSDNQQWFLHVQAISRM